MLLNWETVSWYDMGVVKHRIVCRRYWAVTSEHVRLVRKAFRPAQGDEFELGNAATVGRSFYGIVCSAFNDLWEI